MLTFEFYIVPYMGKYGILCMVLIATYDKFSPVDINEPFILR